MKDTHIGSLLLSRVLFRVLNGLLVQDMHCAMISATIEMDRGNCQKKLEYYEACGLLHKQSKGVRYNIKTYSITPFGKKFLYHQNRLMKMYDSISDHLSIQRG